MGRTTKNRIQNLMDKIQGDKVIWMVLILLLLFSIVCAFSSTTQKVSASITRIDIFFSQIKLIAGGLFIIFCCYWIRHISFFRILSQLGFLVSLVLLSLLTARIGVEKNADTVRYITVSGSQIQVFEVTKVAMVMYLAWAMHAYKNREFKILPWIARKAPSLGFLNNKWALKIVYIYIPTFSVLFLVASNGISSAIIVIGVLFLCIIIGGIEWKDIITFIAMGLVAMTVMVVSYKVSGGELFKRVGEGIERFGKNEMKQELETLSPNSERYAEILDYIRQSEGAKIAIHEGGLIGKGPGKSTQKHSVNLIFSDYIYSFIVEEYGLAGGIIILILYGSLLARGMWITRNCDQIFAKTAVGGLTLLISGQALMHIMYNVDILPPTGQTLPLISDGRSAFLCFCLAFGIILSISRIAKKKMDKQIAEAEPLMDPVREGLDDLDRFESE